MQFGLAGTNTGPYVEPQHARRLARAAEEVGLESLWTYEHVVVPAGYRSTYPYSPTGRMQGDGAAPIADPLQWLGFVAGITDRIGLGTGVVILPEHNPVILAKRCATLDRLSRGRLLLGVGVGWLREEFEALGVSWDDRVSRTEEYIGVLRRLWQDDETTQNGRFVRLDRARSNPKPSRSGRPPVIVGGHSRAAAVRAGRLGDGFFPAAPFERVAELIPVMRAAAAEVGRDPSTVEVTASAGPDLTADGVKTYEAIGVSRLVLRMPTFDPEALGGELHRIGELVVATG